MDGPKYRDSGLTVFRLGYTAGAFDLRDYLSLLRIQGYSRWIFYACADTEKALLMERNQVYRWNTRWETKLILSLKNPETQWRLEQSIYLTKHPSYSLGVDTHNNLSASLTYILP